MATGEIVRDEPAAQAAAARRPRSNVQEKSFWLTLVEAAASLRLTVTLFAMLIFLIFMGTLAQKDQGVWQVVEQTYFRVGFAWIDFQAFARLVQLWTKTPIDNVPGGFWFPGGTLLGVLLGVNLLAAHALRFRVAASGQRLVAGVAVTAIGLGLGAALVLADQRGAVEGVFTSNVQGILWHALRASVAGMALFTAYLFAVSKKPVLSPERMLAGAIALITGAIAVWLYANPAVQLNPSGLRILWLLALCLVVSVVCNAGCVLLFKKRSGIVLLHAGVLLLMIGELIVGLAADEGQMTIPEGGSSNYAVDIRTSELAIVDASNPQEDVVTVVPQRLLAKDEVIEGEGLPFKIKPLEFQPNSFLVPPNAKAANPSTKGAGLAISAMPTKQVSGVDTKQGVDMPSVYAELLDPETDESLGVYLFSASVDRNQNALTPQQVEVGGKTFDVALRFKRQYKPYSVELVDFRFDKFIGTTTAKNYSSDVIIHDDARSIDREARISMNNPTRHAGDTLYQSSFDRTETATVLQVVTNTGRLIPYLSCVMVGLGLFTHFGQTLLRFFDRRDREVAKLATQSHEAGHAWTSPAVVVPAVVTLLVAACVAVQARSGKPDVEAFPVGRFGSLAMVDGGRVKPYDTYARTVLQRLSNRQEINLKKLEEAERPACADGLDKVSASKWLLDVVSGREGAGDYRVFRIDNLDLLDSLKLEARTGSFRYSLNEILARQSKTEADGAETGDQTPSVPEFNRQVDLAAAVAPEERNLFQSRVLALAENISRYRVMDGAFRSFGILGVESFPEGFAQQVAEAAMSLRRAEAPLPVPPQAVDDSWKTVVDAEIESFLKRRQGGEASVTLVALEDALNAYKKQDLRAFTESLDTLETQYAKYQKQLNSPLNAEAVEQLKPAERLSLTKASFETWFNQFSPFTVAAVLYVIAFLFAVSSWIFAPKVLGRTAMAIVALTLVLHTFAILGRLYISGRPPVTNLYSSAVFIGWAMVVFGLIIDGVYRVGVGTALGAAAGFLSMLIAYFLGQDGDTFTVMQAVLDTQFWLATHVVCITLGYGATFMAGALGLAYLAFRNPTLFCGVLAVAIVVLRPILGVEAASGYGLAMNATAIGLIAFAVLFAYKPGDRADTEIERLLTRVTYGVLCFALFFSFIGTVLGGLWADDSWGRFWGWDPKENGAMIIVLWNALILHARWGAMITPRGFAALAVVGNIVTTWSWFGTNELGVGLHAYGGVSDEMSLGLGIMTTALITHLPLLPLASCPRDAWRAWFGGGETAAT